MPEGNRGSYPEEFVWYRLCDNLDHKQTIKGPIDVLNGLPG